MATETQSKSRVNMADELFANGGEMGALMRALDWSKTALGPVERWPQSLKTSVSVCLNSRFAIVAWWGPHLVKLYNDAYIQLIGGKHPHALGAEGRQVWPEIWDTIGPMLQRVLDHGEANWADDLLLLLDRHGYSEECYFTFSYSPIRDESGGVGGVFTPVVETTARVIGDRRRRTLSELVAIARTKGQNADDVCAAATQVFAANPHDLPFAAIYRFDPRTDHTAWLAASANPEIDLPTKIDLRNAAWTGCGDLSRGKICAISLRGLAEQGFGRLPQRPWGAAPEQAVLVPILQAKSPEPIGFLLAGVSIRKRLDQEYEAFYTTVATELGSAIREAEMLERERKLRAEAERTKIRELFMNAPAAIAVLTGPGHRYTLVNGGYLSIVGRKSPEELLDKDVIEVFPELESQGIIALLDGVYRTGVPFAGNELPIALDRSATGDPTEIFFNFVCQPMRGADGEVDGIFVMAIDVTGSVRARQEIEIREEQFRVLADSIPQLAWMADPDGYITWYNRRWYEYTGTTLEQMEGWGWQSVHDPERLPEVMARYRCSLDTGEPFDMAFPLRGADGQFRAFLTRALPVRNAEGTIVRWFGTNTDVELQQKAETALRQSEKLAAVGRLASSIAHEINNPLEAVTNLVYLGRATAVNEETKGYLKSAEQELERVSQITTHTLRFHKQQSAPALTDVSEVLDSILTLHRGKLLRGGIELRLEAVECPRLMCYAGEVRQVLTNLIGNALDAMPKGGVLRLRLRPGTNWITGKPAVRFTIGDSGQGMPRNIMKRIYEPFFTTKGEVGTGLGLWVCAGIVDKHRGSLRVRSSARPGRTGTVFTVVFPHDFAGAS